METEINAPTAFEINEDVALLRATGFGTVSSFNFLTQPLRIAGYIKRNYERNKSLYPKLGLAKWLGCHVPELKSLSETTLSQMFNVAELIELSREKQHTIPDSTRLGFYFVCKGKADLVFQVQQTVRVEGMEVITQEVVVPIEDTFSEKTVDAQRPKDWQPYFDNPGGRFVDKTCRIQTQDSQCQIMYLSYSAYRDLWKAFARDSLELFDFLKKTFPSMLEQTYAQS